MLAQKPAADAFLFLTTTPDDPRNTPAVQTQIRQRVMQDIGKTRRSNDKGGKCPGVLQPWPVIQTKSRLTRETVSDPLERSNGPSDSRGLQSTDQIKISRSPKHGNRTSTWRNDLLGDVWTGPTQTPPRLQLGTLGSGRSNPFLCYPIEMDAKTHRLISYSESNG